MGELRGIDLKRACLVPSSVFSSPGQVVHAQGLSLAQKFAILRRWEFDARGVGSFAGNPSMLAQVERALEGLRTEAGPTIRRTRSDTPGLVELERASYEPETEADAGVIAAHALARARS